MENNAQIYRDQILTNIMLGYPAQGYVFDQILPELPVQDLTGMAFQLDESHLIVPGSSLRTGFARAKRIDFNLTMVNYPRLIEHSLEIGITWDTMRLYKTPLLPETNATNVASGQLMNEKEVAVKNFVTTLGNYASGFKTTLSGTAQIDNAASKLETLALAARRAVKLGCGNYPNKVVINPDVRDAMRQHAEVQTRLQGAVAVTNEQRDAIIRNILQVDELLIADSVYSNQAEGQTSGTKNWIWSDDIVFLYVAPAPALEILSFGYLLRLDPEHSFHQDGSFVGVDKWEEVARKSNFIRANDYYIPWGVANTAGYLYKDALAAY